MQERNQDLYADVLFHKDNRRRDRPSRIYSVTRTGKEKDERRFKFIESRHLEADPLPSITFVDGLVQGCPGVKTRWGVYTLHPKPAQPIGKIGTCLGPRASGGLAGPRRALDLLLRSEIAF